MMEAQILVILLAEILMKSLEYKKFCESLTKISENKFSELILEFAAIWRKLRSTRSRSASKDAAELASLINSQNFYDVNMESSATKYFTSHPNELNYAINLARSYFKKHYGIDHF